jgi:hypothetical protein
MPRYEECWYFCISLSAKENEILGETLASKNIFLRKSLGLGNILGHVGTNKKREKIPRRDAISAAALRNFPSAVL